MFIRICQLYQSWENVTIKLIKKSSFLKVMLIPALFITFLMMLNYIIVCRWILQYYFTFSVILALLISIRFANIFSQLSAYEYVVYICSYWYIMFLSYCHYYSGEPRYRCGGREVRRVLSENLWWFALYNRWTRAQTNSYQQEHTTGNVFTVRWQGRWVTLALKLRTRYLRP